MAKSAQKVTLSPSRDIPFDKLVLSQSNVRRIKAGISVEELAEDIARRGLLQSLSVRPVLADDGSETGKFEIPAGGRRFQALSLLVKQKRLAKTTPIPCIVRDATSAILAEDDSLAENMQRAALHPLDQFRAFVALREKGQGDEEIAAAFFVTPQVVKQRLKLASVAPALLELYAEDEMTLEQLMAFTVNPDHERQVQVWEATRSSWNKEPYQIRRMLTETSVRASDRRAVFVGLKAYEAAGGTMLHDLFQGDDGGWLEDPALLDRLVSEKLQAEAEAIATEGWKWIEVSVDLPYGYSHGLRRLSGDPAPMTDDEGAAHAKLLAEYRALEEEFEGQDEFPEEIDARLGELEVGMEKLEARPLIFDNEEIARAGAFVTLDRYGELAVFRGFVRPEDEPREDADVHSGEQAADGQGAKLSSASSTDGVGHGTVITSAGQALGANMPDDEDDGALKPLPERLVMELTAHRTLALREAVGRSPDVALTLLLLKLVNDTFRTSSSAGSCLEASVRHVYMSAQASDLKDSVVAIRVEAARDSAERLHLVLPKAHEPVAPTHWAFGQLASIVGAPASYLRQLPAPLAGINLQYGLTNHRAEQVKTFETEDGRTELRAVTGPDYGRIHDFELVEAVQRIAGNGTGDTRWKVPGVLDWSTGVYNPDVEISRDTTTLYASDRDVFLFLVDDRNPIEAGKLADGSPDLYFRGFYCWNSEVGAKTLGMASFYLRAVCQNRNLWGVEDFQEIKIRHSKYAASRFALEAAPALTRFANSSPQGFVNGIKAARQQVVARSDEDRADFLRKRGFSKTESGKIIEKVLMEEGRPPESIFDFVQGITRLARDKTQQDARLDMEGRAKRLLDRVG